MKKRWKFPVLMLVCSMLSYLDRNVLAVLSPTLLPALHLSAEQYGWVISGFSIAYMVGNPVWGLAIDRWGVRIAMMAAVSIWSVASASHALAGGFATLLLCRIVLGFGEGATFPGGLAAVALTLPAHERSRGIGIAYSGGALGAVIAPLVIVPVGQIFGWRGAFWATGLAGAIWLLVWWTASRSLTGAAATPGRVARPPMNWRDSRVAAGLLAYCIGAFPLVAGLYISPLFLTRVFGVSQGALAKYLWIPPLGWEVGYLALGWLLDRMGGSRRGMQAFSFLLALLGLPLAWIGLTDSIGIALALLFLGMFAAAGFIVASLNYLATCFGAERSGLLAGLAAGSWSALVALAMPFLGRLIDRGMFFEIFAGFAGMPALAMSVWWGLDAFRPKTETPPTMPGGGAK
jgi:MFS transporter, ACS family, hexuronate transporter